MDLRIQCFSCSICLTKRNFNILQDGSEKLELGLKALAQPEIQKYFGIPVGVDDVLPQDFANAFLCMHVRLYRPCHVQPVSDFTAILPAGRGKVAQEFQVQMLVCRLSILFTMRMELSHKLVF
jgi:hypothetical protein